MHGETMKLAVLLHFVSRERWCTCVHSLLETRFL